MYQRLKKMQINQSINQLTCLNLRLKGGGGGERFFPEQSLGTRDGVLL